MNIQADITGTSKGLRFTSLILANWRNFAQADTTLQRRVFLVGPNASGKSNFLDAFRFLRDLVVDGGGLQEAVRRRGGVSNLRALSARRPSDVLVCAKIGDDTTPDIWTYEVEFTQDIRQRSVLKREIVKKGSIVICERPDDDDQKDPELLTETHIEQTKANREFRTLAEFFASTRYLHLVPQLVREPDRSVGRKDDPYGGDFLETVAKTNEKTRDAWLRRIRDALRVAVPQLTDMELWRDVKGTPHLRGKYKHWRPQGAWQTEEQFSDGTLRLIGLLWAILQGTGPLLLEEPELSLHPEVVRYLPQMLARAQRRTGRQIILSTHSSDLLRDDGIGVDEVLLLNPGAEGTSVSLASAIQDAKTLLTGGMSLADIVVPHAKPQQAEQLLLAMEI